MAVHVEPEFVVIYDAVRFNAIAVVPLLLHATEVNAKLRSVAVPV
jgi:hypothetical protein